MNYYFLLNEAITLPEFENFKTGMLELNAISREDEDIFLKHESIYSIDPIVNQLYVQYGQDEQTIMLFIEQLQPTETYCSDEKTLDEAYPESFNAFLGIDFSEQLFISTVRQITNQISFEHWKYLIASNFEKLKTILGDCTFHADFEKDFENLAKDVQNSIIEGFLKAKNRNLLSPFYPDTKIIKDVTPSNSQYKVLELRIYAPVAIRVYFNESNAKVSVASIEQKSNPNQSDDIQKAAKILKNIIQF